MIAYSRTNPLTFVQWRGSVAPLALRWAAPCAFLAAVYRLAFHFIYVGGPLSTEPLVTITMPETSAWTVFTSILGFLIVFRAKLAYQRYWEGLSLVERACGAWLNSFSSLIAFCSADSGRVVEVTSFQYVLSRMMSLLLCISMCDVSELDHNYFKHLDLENIDAENLMYLDTVDDATAKQKVVLQWIQRLVVEQSRIGVVDIAPPILTRAFQELTIGHSHFIDANKVTAVPFPFAFAQMVWLMLVFFSVLIVPGICAACLAVHKAAFYTFVILFPYWSIHYIAVEIEMPFGQDPNDLPLDVMTRRYNSTLTVLLRPGAQRSPKLEECVRHDVEERHLLDCSVGGDAGGGDASSVIVPGQLPISIALGPPTSRVPSYPSGGSTGHAPSCSSDAPPAFSDETSSHAPSEDGAGGRRASWSYQHKSSRVCLGEDASTPGFVQVGIGRPPPEDHESSEGDNPPKSPGLRPKPFTTWRRMSSSREHDRRGLAPPDAMPRASSFLD